MNEQISEIWDQAAKASALLRSGENSWETQKAFIEKFAELIVRECAEVIIGNEIDHPITGAVYDGDQAKAIKEHFGVEE